VKRSEINDILRTGKSFFKYHSFYLPDFAKWDLKQWIDLGDAANGIIKRKLGWDVTDFGLGDFQQTGLLLFTLRNGLPDALKMGAGETYAEKIMMVNVNQVTPFHFHRVKVEDIINRGGGTLEIQLYQTDESGMMTDKDVAIRIDGLTTTVPAGGSILLTPGQSVRLLPKCLHKFWGLDQPVLVGEVSLVNDDDHDNFFLGKLGRFPTLEEDVPPDLLLCSDYAGFLNK
jgi:D-lyxose ketol-isomerase